MHRLEKSISIIIILPTLEDWLKVQTQPLRETPTCRRCQQLGVHCEGYGIRLHWLQWCPHTSTRQLHSENAADQEGHPHLAHDGPTPQPPSTRRSLTQLGVSTPATAPPRLSSAQLDLALREIDEWYPGSDDRFPALQSACFYVFPVDSPSPLSISSGQDGEHNSNHDDAHATARDQEFDARDAVPFPVTEGQSSLPAETWAMEEQSTDALTALPAAQTLVKLRQDCIRDATPVQPRVTDAHTIVLDDALQMGDGIDTLDRKQQEQPQLALQEQVQNASPRHLNDLEMPARQRRLIHHWVTFTSRKIVLIDDAFNPCRTMMLPMAWQGLVSRPGESNANMAIFHALCASAAFNLYELSGRVNDQDRILALDHEQRAVQHLRYNLTRAHQHRDQSFAMAIMACIAVEAVSGTTQRWRTHVSGGLGYLTQLQAQGVDETILSAFRNHMVKMAILSGFTVPHDLKSFLEDDTDDGALEFTFPYYGVSRSFLQALDRMNMLADSTVPVLDRDLDALELQLYLGHPSGILQRKPPFLAPSAYRVVHHTAMAFYYAGLVFLQRRIRQAPVAHVQDLVDLGVQELESVERVGGGQLGCMMLWPALVLGAECSRPQIQTQMKTVSKFDDSLCEYSRIRSVEGHT